ncbi:MAG: BlaI/MecI/CopY family transcriptional regulator [Crocinitomicaceae bacterium]|jgi:predicted transcriptional regulator|nr:BlaI/MecI/CopY family transcriptional regulator [Crocinitomicaceae bacterium]
MERLTPAEELVMLKLWKLEKAAVKDIQALFEEPKPAYNTTSTIVRILERKKFIKHQSIGRGYLYSPKISRESYRQYLLKHLMDNYFDGVKNDLMALLK